MKHKLKRWLSALLAVCMVVSTSVMTANAANGTATLSSTTMTESGSIEVSFSGTASDTEYYNVQIADSSWSTTYVNTNITSGDSYTISGYSAGSYQIYVGYWENGGWVGDALSTTAFTVTEDDSSDDSGDSGTSNGSASLSSTTMTESGSIEVTFSGTASSTEYYVVEIADESWSTIYVDKVAYTSGTGFTISGYSAGTYQIYIGYYEDGSWKSDALSTTTFTVTEDDATTYGLSLSASDTTPALDDSVTIFATITVDGTDTGIPDGCTLSIWYQHDNDWVTPVNGSSTTTSTTISLSSANFTDGSTYTVEAALYDSDWNALVSDSVTFTVTGDNTGSGGSTDTYAVTIIPSATTCEQNESITFTISVTYGDEEIDLSEQSDVYLWVWADSWADGHSEGLTDCTISPNTGLSNSVTIEFPSVGTYYIAYNLQDSSYTDILRSTDVATITVTESTTEASEEITTGTLSCDFMRGMDLSTFYTNWTNGAVYYDYEGTEYSQSKGNAVDFFKFLYKDCGVNWVRLCVWNDPYDEDGNPYGGGNNDVATAAIIGKWASDAGMTVLIDFHYSDFWADPGRQLAPKAWADMTIDEKVDTLYTYTYDSLEYLLDAGVNVGMVQVGNETNGSLCGEKITTWSDYDTNEGWQNMVSLFKSGSKAVRDISDEYDTNIKVALHFTNPNNNNPSWYCGLLVDAGVDFDAIGISYYMYWHGTLSNLANEINTINNTYGKEAFIAETAYPYSSENYDNLGNQITSFDDFDMNANLYAISEKGQEAALTAILSTLSGTNCTGLFYWEAAWTTIDSDDYRDAGGGWATKWASDYISYSMSASEGSSFDNQALFNNDDKALPALKYYVDFVEGTENLPEHNYELDEDASTAATCTEDGENVYVCTVCGDSYTETVSATGHSYGTPDFSWSDDHSTCTATFTCENDNSHVTTVDCTVNSETTAAACTEEGKTVYTATCTFNGAEYADEQTVEIDATGHTEADAVTENEVAATCTEAGSYDEVVYCSVCKAELSRETVTVPATGHSYEATEVVAPTYAAQGYTVYTCPDCGDSYRADYTDVLVLDEADEGLNIQQKVEDLTTLPEGLAHLYADVEELRAALISQVTVKAGYTEDNTAVYDVTLQYRVDGGAWADATEDNFPLSGVTVTLPYPDGTDSSYDFVVLHMFTVTSERLGTAAGQTEFPTVTKTEDGLVVTLTGLSPVAIAWKEPDETTSVSSSTTTATSSSSVSSSSSTDSSSSTSSSSASSPKTGDEAQPMLWMALFLIACGGLAAVVIYLRRKQD